VKNIIVLGGGTAGLVTCLVLKRTFPEYNITVIESDSIGIIGVGESSTEHWYEFMNYCNINVSQLLRETDATIKKGIKFDNWNGDNKSYFHSVDGNFYNRLNPVYSFYSLKVLIANGIKIEDALVDTNLVEYVSGINTSKQYQFNTFKLNEYLHLIAKERGVIFVKDDIDNIKLTETGDVKSLISKDGAEYAADFFVDSSGFKRLISSKLGAKWVSYSKYLPMNHALAFPTEDTSDLKPYTLSRALGSGWNWRIATSGRHGNGYVFCDKFIDATKAHDEIQSYYKEEVKVAKDIKFEAGRVDKFWINNCVSIGLSSSFVEPLEATSIGNTILQAFGLCKMLPAWEVDRKICKVYDDEFIKSFNNIVDFVQLHYMTKRNDTEFWRELPSIMEQTDFIKDNLEMFKKVTPVHSLFKGEFLMFNSHNWNQVMAGLELYDIEYLNKSLINKVGKGKIDSILHEYEQYLNNIEGNSYIDHATLLKQNNIVVKLNRN
jgi:tryptophan halogenase